VRRAAATALAACVLSATALAAGAAAANTPIARHTAKDMALARRALIAKGEVGKGWQPVKTVSGRSTLTCPASNPSMAGIVETGAASTGYRGDAQVIGQTVWVYRTNAQAAKLWRRAAGAGFLRCQVAVARSAGGLTVTKLRSGALDVPKLAARTAAYRVIVTAKVKGKSLDLYYDNFLLAQGRTVTQILFGSAHRIPSAVELALGRAVAKRLGSSGVA
jgi:hypothetical protein